MRKTDERKILRTIRNAVAGDGLAQNVFCSTFKQMFDIFFTTKQREMIIAVGRSTCLSLNKCIQVPKGRTISCAILKKRCIFAMFLRAKNSSPKALIGTILFPVCYLVSFFETANADKQLFISVFSGLPQTTRKPLRRGFFISGRRG